jgi:hypothetical protein
MRGTDSNESSGGPARQDLKAGRDEWHAPDAARAFRHRGDYVPRNPPPLPSLAPGLPSVPATTVAARPRLDPRALAKPANRGILLDLTVFVLNLLVTRELARRFLDTIHRAGAGDTRAVVTIGVCFAAMVVLPAAGATLNRWHYHQRHDADAAEEAFERAAGCLLNPAFYLAVTLIISMVAATIFAQQLFGEGFANRAGVFMSLIGGVLLVSIVQTVMVFRYFSPPRGHRGAFWTGPYSMLLGDACIFINMLLYQVMWHMAFSAPFAPVSGLEDAAGRIFLLWFVSILVYFPPRIFYLAEDGGRAATWGTILLANSPAILHVFGVF